MTDRIRTTHTGSLPRPPELAALLFRRERGEPVDTDELDAAIAAAVEAVVKRQRSIGIDIINDGEMSKISYATYVKHRYAGISGRPRTAPRVLPDAVRFPVWGQIVAPLLEGISALEYTCDGPLVSKDEQPLYTDLGNLAAAAAGAGAHDVFMTAASPGIVADYIANRHYPTHEAYLDAIAAALRPEYEAIVDAGYLLQIDCPDLSAVTNGLMSEAELTARKHHAIDAINAATAGIDPRRMRMHLCWGNLEGPHDRDIPLEQLLPIVSRARPHAISFEGANPRHEHEWEVFAWADFPADKVIVPGVIDSTTNFIEHPKLVAQRIARYTAILGPERVIAGVDCGFGTHALLTSVDPDIAYAKLAALVEGAALASAG